MIDQQLILNMSPRTLRAVLLIFVLWINLPLINGSDLCNAVSISFGDNIQTVYRSDDGGNTFTQIGFSGAWPAELRLDIETVSANTILKYVVQDYGVVGGFLGIIQWNDNEYEITDPLTHGNWELIYPSDGITSLVYTEDQNGPWKRNQVYDDVNTDTLWVWNGDTYNWMTFQFNFATLIQALNETPAPQESTPSVNVNCPYQVTSDDECHLITPTPSGTDCGNVQTNGIIVDANNNYVTTTANGWIIQSAFSTSFADW